MFIYLIINYFLLYKKKYLREIKTHLRVLFSKFNNFQKHFEEEKKIILKKINK